jgi:hypothetical protein
VCIKMRMLRLKDGQSGMRKVKSKGKRKEKRKM